MRITTTFNRKTDTGTNIFMNGMCLISLPSNIWDTQLLKTVPGCFVSHVLKPSSMQLSILHGVDPLSYFSFQPVLHDWCNKGRGMCYPVCGMVHIKEPLLLIDKSSLCGGSGFPFSLSEWSLTICLTPYNCR